MIGKHKNGVKKLFWANNTLISFSFDATFKFWKLGQPQAAASFDLPGPVHAADVNYPLIFIATG